MKTKNKNELNLKYNSGITLIALIITIIILLILAGITLNMLLGDNGIIKRANEAGETTKIEDAKEKVGLMLAEYQISKYAEQLLSSNPLYDFFFTKVGTEIESVIDDSVNNRIIVDVDGYEFAIDKDTLKIILESTSIKIKIEYPDGTIGDTAKAIVTIIENKKQVDTSSLQYGWSNLKTTEPTTWLTDIIPGQAKTITQPIVGQEKWFLWVRGRGEGDSNYTTKISSQFNREDTQIPTVNIPAQIDGRKETSVEVTVNVTYGFSGIKTIQCIKDGSELIPITGSDSTYTFTATKNGTYTVTVEGNNNKTATANTQVINVFDPVPVGWIETTIVDTSWYSYTDALNLNEVASVNAPILVGDMKAIKYEGISDELTNITVGGMGETNTSKWANAILKEGSMLVWIPRYAYQITYTNPSDKSKGGTIDIKFLKDDTNKDFNGNDVESQGYIVHPAFTFGENNLTGIWVGKFETGYKGTSNPYAALIPTPDIGMAVVKPNVCSWRGINASNMYKVCREMQITDNIYGLPSSGVNTHMMKNTEWGAVAYLAHSKYGRNKIEVSKNRNSSYWTGYGDSDQFGGAFTPLLAYDGKYGILSSTTGNVYGVYDMSGGCYDRTMSVLNKISGSSGFSASFFNDPNNDKYYDNYTGYNNTIIGDAVFETSNWFKDLQSFMVTSSPWCLRSRILE